MGIGNNDPWISRTYVTVRVCVRSTRGHLFFEAPDVFRVSDILVKKSKIGLCFHMNTSSDFSQSRLKVTEIADIKLCVMSYHKIQLHCLMQNSIMHTATIYPKRIKLHPSEQMYPGIWKLH